MVRPGQQSFRSINAFGVALLLIGVANLASGAAGHDLPVIDGDNILFIGNSFSDWHGGVDIIVSEALAAGSPPVSITTKRIFYSSIDLDYHWRREEMTG